MDEEDQELEVPVSTPGRYSAQAITLLLEHQELVAHIDEIHMRLWLYNVEATGTG